MVIAVPFIMAAAAYAGASALGYAALAGVAASAAYLVGSWIIGPQTSGQNVVDPKANGAPPFNTSIRGATIPVLFGTNRVASQPIWQTNFQAIKNETTSGGGGGKFGGSGGKGGSKVTNTAYTYKVDAIYHLGMPYQESHLFSAWLGGQRVNDNCLSGIVSNLSVTQSPFLGGVANGATVNWDDAVYYGGTRGSVPSAWSPFTSNIGFDVRLPGTAWVGFQGLDLGGVASMPQLSFEIGPTATGVLFQPTNFYKYQISTQQGGASSLAKPIGPDQYGQHYWWTDSGNSLVMTDNTLNLIGKWDFQNDIYAAVEAKMGAQYISGSASKSTLQIPQMVAFQQGHYLLMTFRATYKSTRLYQHLVVLEVFNGTMPTVKAAVRWNCPTGLVPAAHRDIMDLHVLGGDDPIYAVFRRGDTENYGVWLLPSPSAIIDGIVSAGAASPYVPAPGECVASYFTLADHWAGLWAAITTGNFNDNDVHAGVSWLLPQIISDIGIPAKDYILNAFVTKEHIAKSIAAGSTTTNGGCAAINDSGNTVGFFITVNVSLAGGTPVSSSFPNCFNMGVIDPQINPGLMPGYPWSDVGQYFDGTAGSTDQYRAVPSVFGLTDVSYVVLFHRLFTDANAHNSGSDSSNLLCPVIIHAFVYTIDGNVVDLTHGSGYLLNWNNSLTVTAQTNGGDFGNGLFYYDGTNVIFVSNEPASGTSIGYGYVWKCTLGQLKITGGGDLTPPEIIKAILVDPMFGLQPGADIIDDTSYGLAVQYCQNNGIYVSTQYRQSENVLTIIDMLLAVYGGFLTVSQNRVKFGYVTGLETPVRTIDNNHLIPDKPGSPPVTVTKGAQQDTFNKVRVNFFDRTLDYNQNQVEEGDEVDQDFTGIRAQEFPAQFVMDSNIARQMAARTLWSNLYVRDIYNFNVGFKDADLEPGDTITLVDSYDSLQQVVRIVKRDTKKRGVYNLQAVQVVQFAVSAVSSVAPQQAYQHIDFVGPAPKPLYASAYELPAEFQGSQPQVYVGWVPDNQPGGAVLYVSGDGASYAPAITETGYPTAGRLYTSLSGDPGIVFQEDVEFFLFPTDSLMNTPSFNETWNDVGLIGMHNGAQLVWVGSEMLALYNLTIIGQNHYRAKRAYRGWGGTTVQSHLAGDFWFQHGGGFNYPYNEDKIGTTFFYKVVPFNIAGQAYDVSSVAGKQYQILGTYYRPQAPGAIQFNGNRGITQLSVGSTIDMPFTWPNGARKSGFGVGGTGKQGFGAFATDTISVAWRVEVVGSGGLVVRSLAVSTPGFTYTSSMNAADNGAWYGSPAIKVTPFGQYGDALRSSVISMGIS